MIKHIKNQECLNELRVIRNHFRITIDTLNPLLQLADYTYYKYSGTLFAKGKSYQNFIRFISDTCCEGQKLYLVNLDEDAGSEMYFNCSEESLLKELNNIKLLMNFI